MKATTAILCFLLLLLMGYFAFEGAMPAYAPDADAPAESFSTDRAMQHVQNLAAAPHAVGFPAHSEVRSYIVQTLTDLGLEPELQTGYTAGDWGNLSRATNILARIPGTRSGKALVLMSHYDSAPHASFGASDAGSGVAVILEGLRAFLAAGNRPANDLIILITDAEELGLNGADLFVNQHPWAQEAGLVLNFEARGSGGPGYMLIETNGGNARLIEAFTEAHPKFPVANSLAYSIYKMLPNDTDLTVFREDGDIEGFNFAFIDDHFDYHTALDLPERLDGKTMAHQGSYLMPLLSYFSNADLSGLKSEADSVYFNLPYFGLMHYPQQWAWPLWAAAALLFLCLVGWRIQRGRLHGSGIAKGFLPMLLALVVNAAAGYAAWPLLKVAYPAYTDMLHGFTYNGYFYIAAWATLAAGICFWAYSLFKKLPPADALIAPAFLWLVLCAALTYFLPGAAFFIVPGFALLMTLMVLMGKDRPNPYGLTALALPGLWIFVPFVKMFPVGLGLKMLIAASLMSTFIFLLLLGVLLGLPHRRRWAGMGILVFVILLFAAHLSSSFTEARPKPSSLLYVLDADAGKAQWASYDKIPSAWTQAFLGDTPTKPEPNGTQSLSSKYGTGFSFTSEAPVKPIAPPEVRRVSDTLLGATRQVVVELIPQRPVNRLEVFSNGIALSRAEVNGIPLSEYYLQHRRGGKLITHYVSDNDSTRLLLEYPADASLELHLYEASNNLLDHPDFSVPPRPASEIPMPFVLNDAILVHKKIRFE